MGSGSVLKVERFLGFPAEPRRKAEAKSRRARDEAEIVDRLADDPSFFSLRALRVSA